MAYKVKRGQSPTDSNIRDMLISFFKRMIAVLIVLGVMIVIGYLVFNYAYGKFPVFADAADDVIKFVKSFYAEHGFWITVGMIVFICIAVWAFGEESRRRDRRKETMKEIMK